MKFSVIIPTYNEAKYIVPTVQQWQALRAKGVELILTDDGSGDATIQLASGLVDQVVHRPDNMQRGIGSNRNRGAAVAQGDILWFLDADVHIPNLDQVYETVLTAFTQRTTLVALTLKARVLPNQQRWADIFWLGWRNIIIYISTQLLHLGFGSGECQIIRRTTFLAVQGYHPIVATEDHDLFHRLAKYGRVKMWWSHYIEISPRRFHQDGWLRVLWLWGRVLIGWFIFGQANKQPWAARR